MNTAHRAKYQPLHVMPRGGILFLDQFDRGEHGKKCLHGQVVKVHCTEAATAHESVTRVAHTDGTGLVPLKYRCGDIFFRDHYATEDSYPAA